MTIQQFKKDAALILSETSPSPQLDIQVLLEYKLNYSKTELLLHNNDEITQENLEWLNLSIKKRQKGLPIAYITGHKEFFGYDFFVSTDVLIPKPDTEILVERAIELILEKIEAHPDSILTICDMCTGSGCIGLSVLKTLSEDYNISSEKLPAITFVDISNAALEVAQKNYHHLFDSSSKINKVHFIRSNLFETITTSFDFILTNPPYIPHSMVDNLLLDGRNEPRLALDGDISLSGDRALTEKGIPLDDGLEIIRNLLPQAKTHINPFGTILMETGEYNAKEAALLTQKQEFSTTILKDLEGQLRVVEGHLKPQN